MTVIQQQRLIGATLVALLVAVLAWLVLASVDTQETNTSQEPDEPIVFEPVVEPISDEIAVTEAGDNASESAAEDLETPAQQSETKVVIPAQNIENQSSIDEALTSTNSVAKPEKQTAPEDSTTSDELTALAEELDTAEAESAPESDPQPQTNDSKPTETTNTSQEGDDSGDSKQWVIQLGSFSKSENAQSLQRQMQASDYEAVIEEAEIDGRKIYRVRLPADDDRARLEQIADELAESQGLKPQILTVNP